MSKRILIIDDYDDLATALSEQFRKQGHHVTIVTDRDDAVRIAKAGDFEVIIADLDGVTFEILDEDGDVERTLSATDSKDRSVKAFNLSFSEDKLADFDEEQLLEIVKTTLSFKSKYIDRGDAILERYEFIQFNIPSALVLMDDILGYLMKRFKKLDVVNPEKSNLFVALDEAFVNAVKHGNKFDATKLVKISVEITPQSVRFTIEDEGDGFNIEDIPDPTKPENMFRTSGRGVMFISNIMDKVEYNERGNRLTMIKNSECGD